MPKPVIDHKCTNCGTCIDLCPVDVFDSDDKKPKVTPSLCIGCRACEVQCPDSALEIKD